MTTPENADIDFFEAMREVVRDRAVEAFKHQHGLTDDEFVDSVHQALFAIQYPREARW